MVQQSIHQLGKTNINIYVPSNRASKYMKQKLTNLNGEIDISTIGTDFDAPLSIMGRQRKINKEREKQIH